MFVVKGLVSGSLFLQDVPGAGGNGGALTFVGPVSLNADKWFLGGDVRQTRLTFTIRGPEVLGGATPTGVTEMDLGGYNYQILAVGGVSAGGVSLVPGTNAMTGAPTVTPTAVPLPYNTVTNEPRFDESLVPRIRLAYVELNWNASQNVLRVGQYHNLLLGMVPGSASHIATPLGYGAGQLGWRSPGVTFIHRFKLSPESNLDVGVQVNRNSWRDELPTCSAAQAAPASNCLPYGVSLGEASMLPQVEARIMAFGGMATMPLPFYLPTKWQVFVVGHWDQKDMTGRGNAARPAATMMGQYIREAVTTYAVAGGAKIQLGPVLAAVNGWYGQNAGNVFGHIFQMQDLYRGDVSGFGAWAQLGFGITKNLSAWGFFGIDKPDEAKAMAAFPTNARLQNMQLAAQIAYTDGPIQIAAEFVYVATKNLVVVPPNPATMAPGGSTMNTYSASQPVVTMNYNF